MPQIDHPVALCVLLHSRRWNGQFLSLMMYYFWRQKSPWKSSFGAFLKLKVIHLCNWLGRQQSGSAPRKNLKSRLWRCLEVFSNQKVDRVSEQWKILRTRNVYTTNRCNTQRHFFFKIDVQSFFLKYIHLNFSKVDP